MKIKTIAIASMFFSFGALAVECDKNNFDKCKTCDQLQKAIDIKDPDFGDYYRGALWNGLYAAYVRNCPVVAEKLLSSGATPSLGGYLGSMGGVITQKWPHNDESINLAWADLLIKHGFGISNYSGDYKSATEVWANDVSRIEYKSVWNKLVSSSEFKPLEAARNLEWCASEKRNLFATSSLQKCTYKVIAELDDGVSPASEISLSAVNSCRDELKFFTSGIACKMAVDNKSSMSKPELYNMYINSSENNNAVFTAVKELTIKQVLEYRAINRKAGVH